MKKLLVLLFAFFLSISIAQAVFSKTNQYHDEQGGVPAGTLQANCNAQTSCVGKVGSKNWCYNDASVNPKAKAWLCADGKWDKCDANDKCESRVAASGTRFYCDGSKWTTTKPPCAGTQYTLRPDDVVTVEGVTVEFGSASTNPEGITDAFLLVGGGNNIFSIKQGESKLSRGLKITAQTVHDAPGGFAYDYVVLAIKAAESATDTAVEEIPATCGSAVYMKSGQVAVLGKAKVKLIDVPNTYSAVIDINGVRQELVQYGYYTIGGSHTILASVLDGDVPSQDWAAVIVNPTVCKTK